MEKQLQSQINDQIALTLGRQMIELIAAQATITALQAELQKQADRGTKNG
jgi:hypothetical protein